MAAPKQKAGRGGGGGGGVGWMHVEDGESSGGITNRQVC